MIRFLLSVAISIVSAAVALLVISWVVDGVTVQRHGFRDRRDRVHRGPGTARRRSSSTWRASTPPRCSAGSAWSRRSWRSSWRRCSPNGLQINGITAWIFATLVVWVITALGTWILGVLIIKRWWEKRQLAKATATGHGRSAADAS